MNALEITLLLDDIAAGEKYFYAVERIRIEAFDDFRQEYEIRLSFDQDEIPRQKQIRRASAQEVENYVHLLGIDDRFHGRYSRSLFNPHDHLLRSVVDDQNRRMGVHEDLVSHGNVYQSLLEGALGARMKVELRFVYHEQETAATALSPSVISEGLNDRKHYRPLHPVPLVLGLRLDSVVHAGLEALQQVAELRRIDAELHLGSVGELFLEIDFHLLPEIVEFHPHFRIGTVEKFGELLFESPVLFGILDYGSQDTG